MADVHDSITRSRNMAAILGKNTKPELIVRRSLHRAGLRFRLHIKLPGRPDIVLPKHKTVIFVHGCFWHRHDCPNGRVMPATRRDFWKAKLEGNAERDRRNQVILTTTGWHIHTIWECEITTERLEQLADAIKNGPRGTEPHYGNGAVPCLHL